MMKYGTTLLLTVVIVTIIKTAWSCKTADWRNMTMEELLLKSSVVVYGKDVGHGKYRLPTMLDARFDVFCVIKTGENLVPGQVVIEDIRNAEDACSGVREQTQVGREYILGLEREFSGFMAYANINPLQKTAFPATKENLDKLAAACDLDDWTPPNTGDKNKCPAANKPRFCTKVRYPGSTNTESRIQLNNFAVLTCVAISLCLLKMP